MKHRLIEVAQYISLSVGLVIAALAFQQTFLNVQRFVIITVTSLLYVVWGYWHHSYKDRFDKIILLEYSLVALIVILLSALGLGIVRFL